MPLTIDPRLDRRREFDEQSRQYNVRSLWGAAKSDTTALPRSFTWGCDVNLDQGQEGACVGFAWSHERAAKPKPDRNITDNVALNLYARAKQLDEWPGENYDGTSVLAGAKAAKESGWLGEYRWAFSTIDALTAISRHGPAVIGINWYSGMWEPDESGFVRKTGTVVGGHAILVRGVNVRKQFVVLHNSWGPRWGLTPYGPGTALLSWDDFDKLLGEGGECCVPVVRR